MDKSKKRMKKRVLLAGGLAALILLAAACGKDKVLEPVEVREGVDRCEVCGMLVSNDEHAVQLRLDDGQTKFFDDLGDLFVWTDEHGLDDVNVRYVRDKHTKEWLQIEQATFVYDAEFRTPMGYGVLSFEKKEDAEAFVEGEGKGIVLSYDDLLNHHWESNMGHHDHDGHDGHHGDDTHHDHNGEHGHHADDDHHDHDGEHGDHADDDHHDHDGEHGHHADNDHHGQEGTHHEVEVDHGEHSHHDGDHHGGEDHNDDHGHHESGEHHGNEA